MPNQKKTNRKETTANNNEQPKNRKWGMWLWGVGGGIVTTLVIGGLIWVYVWVCRTYLGDKQTEIGLPGFVALRL